MIGKDQAPAKVRRNRSRLRRPRQAMPAFIRNALRDTGSTEAYCSRPPYQRNDYLSWIKRAKLQQAREHRLAQMLDELARGDRYMKMAYRPKGIRTQSSGRHAGR